MKYLSEQPGSELASARLSKDVPKISDFFRTGSIWLKMKNAFFRKVARILCKNASKLTNLNEDL